MAEHIYFRVVYELISPMAIGSGSNESTDSDAVTDSRGLPVIPASSIAGVMRSYADDRLKSELFGEISGEHSVKSLITVYDAVQTRSSCVAVRDCVRLQNRVAADGAKFDFEAVETGAEFTGFIELNKYASEYEPDVIGMLSAMNSGVLRFGAKTVRGYGRVRISSIKEAVFDMDSELDSWLDFDMFDDKSWNDKRVRNVELRWETADKTFVRIRLRQKGALSIRSYTTENKTGEKSAPDYKYLSLRNGTPVISGTSWCGAFRSRFSEFAADENAVREVFGYVDGETNDRSRSKIVFDESSIINFTAKSVTRNSIDRFSGAAKDSALYTEVTCYNGETELAFMMDKKISERNRNILAAVIADLDKGYLAVGGLSSIGRGLFAVEQLNVNGADRTARLKAGELKGLLSGGNE